MLIRTNDFRSSNEPNSNHNLNPVLLAMTYLSIYYPMTKLMTVSNINLKILCKSLCQIISKL